MKKALKRSDQILKVIHRLRMTTGATWPQVKDYLHRRGYWPLSQRSNFVKFVNDSFVVYWTRRKEREVKNELCF